MNNAATFPGSPLRDVRDGECKFLTTLVEGCADGFSDASSTLAISIKRKSTRRVLFAFYKIRFKRVELEMKEYAVE